MYRSLMSSAVKALRKQKLYVAITAIGLSLALGASLLILSFVNYEMSFEECHENSDRIYRISGKKSRGDVTWFMATTMYPLGPAMKEAVPEIIEQVRLRKLENVAVVTELGSTFTEPKFLLADPSVFRVFSIPLIHGDPQRVLSRPSSVVISERLSRDLFASADPLGQTITIHDSLALTITGVMADMPHNTQLHTDFIASLSTVEKTGEDMNSWIRGSGFPAYTFFLLDDGADPAVVDERLPDVMASHIGDEAAEYELRLQQLESLYFHSKLSDELGPTGSLTDVKIFAGISLLLVLMACFNYINLSVSRVYQRHREVVARSISGASRAQLFVQFLAESVLLTSASMLLGLVLYELSIPYLEQYVGKSIEIGLTNNTFVWLAAPCLVFFVGVLSGCYPAAALLRLRPQEVMHHRFSVGSGKSKLRRCLVVVQAFMAIALVAFTVGMQQQLNFIGSYDYGFESRNVFVVEFDEDTSRNQKERLKQGFRNAGLAGATLAVNVPGESRIHMLVARVADSEESERQYLSAFTGDAEYGQVLGLKLLRGRFLADAEVADLPGAALVNESAARLLGLDDPIGAKLASSRGPLTIVGVVKDFLALSFHNEVMPGVVLKSSGDERVLAVHLPKDERSAWMQRVQDIWTSVLPARTLNGRWLSHVMADSYEDERKLISLLSLSSGLAVFIACIGLLGLVSSTVERRTKEVGIRKSIGASVPSIVRLLTSEFVVLVALAGLLAWPLAHYAVSRWLENFVFRIEFAWVTHALVVATILVLSMSVVSIQVVRSALANPVEALRHE